MAFQYINPITMLVSLSVIIQNKTAKNVLYYYRYRMRAYLNKKNGIFIRHIKPTNNKMIHFVNNKQIRPLMLKIKNNNIDDSDIDNTVVKYGLLFGEKPNFAIICNNMIYYYNNNILEYQSTYSNNMTIITSNIIVIVKSPSDSKIINSIYNSRIENQLYRLRIISVLTNDDCNFFDTSIDTIDYINNDNNNDDINNFIIIKKKNASIAELLYQEPNIYYRIGDIKENKYHLIVNMSEMNVIDIVRFIRFFNNRYNKENKKITVIDNDTFVSKINEALIEWFEYFDSIKFGSNIKYIFTQLN